MVSKKYLLKSRMLHNDQYKYLEIKRTNKNLTDARIYPNHMQTSRTATVATVVILAVMV